ncbi:carbonic anhydrase family protein [Apibacter muscae]|uniref:carbonic anhydrase n=1 Tax=Apibacter muscae TaxID=2509004 RepID=UPI0011ABAB1A|nr:carbonic anhydrase family protein [Apibacter muscae]TWP23335.1 carbonic anhydrase family protein [Apibacter muscae]
MKKLLILVGILSFSFSNSQEHHWGYEGSESPEHWGEIKGNEQCGKGKYQSPIDIYKSTKNKKLPKLKFQYGSGEIEKIEDNGHSLQFDFKEGSSINFNGQDFTLAQFHAHEESEHTIDGVRYPLELHFVHRSMDGKVLVIGVMVKEGDENSYFERLKVFKNLGKEQNQEVHVSFNPEKLYPKDKTFYTYIGSLTTPPCAENVTWIIFKNPILMSEHEIEDIAKHLPKSNNRPIQPLNGRRVENN